MHLINDTSPAAMHRNAVSYRPSNIVAPVISGTGVRGTVHTCSSGSWNNYANSFNYTWKVAGVAVAFGQNYTPVVGDVSKTLTCEVVGSNGHASVAAVSNGIVVT